MSWTNEIRIASDRGRALPATIMWSASSKRGHWMRWHLSRSKRRVTSIEVSRPEPHTSPVAEIEESAAVKDRIETDVRPYQTSNIERFRKEVKNSEVIVLPNTNHYFFRDPKLFDNVVSTVRRFLLEPTQ